MRRKSQAMTAAFALAGMMALPSAQAEVTYSFSGFGTLGATHSDTRDADYRGSILQPNGPGRSGSTKFGVDTKLGVQGVANFGGGLSGTVQVVADHRADNSYRPEFEWANLKYQIDNHWYVRAGRIVAPVFMISDFRNVGYSQTSVRPAYELYMLNPMTHLDGGEIGAKFEVAGGTLSAQASGGRIKVMVKNRGDYQAIQITGSDKNVNLTYEKGSSTFRIGYNLTKTNSQNDDITAIERAFSAGAYVGYPTPNANLHDIKATLWDVGYAYDDGKWLAQAEFVHDRSDGPAVQDTNAWSALLGYRAGKFTPYAGFSSMRSKEPPLKHPPANAGSPGSSWYPMLSALANGINYFDSMINTHNQQHTVTLGTRYELYKDLALKAQWDRTFKPSMLPGLNRGAFMNPTTAFAEGSHTVNLYTVTLDFVF